MKRQPSFVRINSMKLCLFLVAAILVFGFKIETGRTPLELKKELGHRLFYDKRLSENGTKSCATCHDPNLGFTDGYRKSLGLYGDETRFNSPSVLNMDGFLTVSWADSALHSLVVFLERPMFGTTPKELGLTKSNVAILDSMSNTEEYKGLLEELGEPKLDWATVESALVHYISNLYSRNSKFDQLKEKKVKLSKIENLGFKIYLKNCQRCHGGKDFNSSLEGGNNFSAIFSESETSNSTLLRVRIPSLRNLPITAPYMHDGRFDKISDCFNHSKAKAFNEDEKLQLLGFLNTLIDTSYLKNSYYLDPLQQYK